MQKIYSCLFGSTLFGTSTPTSDRDEKHIVLPSLDDLLVGKQPKNKVEKTNDVKNTRNSADDIDREFIPIQVFAKDFYMGQTYALELAFSIDGYHAEQTFYDNPANREADAFYLFTKELRSKFLTSNIRAMMGYVVNQASMYSMKGERLNASKDVLEAFDDIMTDDRTKEKVAKLRVGEMFDGHLNFRCIMQDLAKQYPSYFKIEEYDIGDGRSAPCFTLLSKTIPFSNTMEHTMGVLKKIVGKYGTRAEAASETNVDWKATMHALRILDEGLALLTSHELDFPMIPERALYLLSIKRGEVGLDTVTNEINEKLDKLRAIEKTTSLPPASQEMGAELDRWLALQLRKFYKL